MEVVKNDSTEKITKENFKVKAKESLRIVIQHLKNVKPIEEELKKLVLENPDLAKELQSDPELLELSKELESLFSF